MSIPPLSGNELSPIRRAALIFELEGAADQLRQSTFGRYERAAQILERLATREQAAADRSSEAMSPDGERGV